MNRREFASGVVGAAAIGIGGISQQADAQQAKGAANAPFRFSVMLWTLKKLGTLDQAMQIVSQAGYTGVELVGEYRTWTEADFTRIMGQMKTLGLKVDSMAGIKGSFADPAGGDALLADMKGVLVVAKRLGCGQLLVTSGKRPAGVSGPEIHAACVENLKRVADFAEKAGVDVVIEPIDQLENPTIYMTSVTEGFDLVRAVGSSKIKVLYDIYHEQRQTGNLMEKLEKNIDLIGLFHIASVPGRHEPSTGEIRYEAIYRKMAELKYNGYLAMEYYPTSEAVASLRSAREQVLAAIA